MDAKTDMNQASKVTRQKKSHKKWAAIVFFVILIIFFDMSPFGGNGRFYSKWLECGGRPVGTNLEWRFGGGNPPYYGEPPTFSLMRGSPEYFCTPTDAEQAGYSANPDRYEFPHLRTNQ